MIVLKNSWAGKMIRKCPNNKWHWGNECRCIEKNPFFFYDGSWHTYISFHAIKADHNMISWSGQLKSKDFISDILKITFFCLFFVSMIFLGVMLSIAPMGETLRNQEQHKIDQQK